MKNNEPGRNAFDSLMENTMGGFQKNPPSREFDMKGFMDMREWQGLKEQELFYRATDYRGS